MESKGFCMDFLRLHLKVLATLMLLFAQFSWEMSTARAMETTSQQEKAVTEASPEFGFKLSQSAIQNIGVETQATGRSAGKLTLPKSALVHSLNLLAVYRLREGWFKLVPINLVSQKGDLVTFLTANILDGDRIVIQGAALLRVAEMETFGGGE
jgi:hypothetical protein